MFRDYSNFLDELIARKITGLFGAARRFKQPMKTRRFRDTGT
jgi:hypothetical protein